MFFNSVNMIRLAAAFAFAWPVAQASVATSDLEWISSSSTLPKVVYVAIRRPRFSPLLTA